MDKIKIQKKENNFNQWRVNPNIKPIFFSYKLLNDYKKWGLGRLFK